MAGNYGITPPQFEANDGLATRTAKAISALGYKTGQLLIRPQEVQELATTGITQFSDADHNLMITLAQVTDRVVLTAFNLVTHNQDPLGIRFRAGPDPDTSSDVVPLQPMH